jgi:hypothetical protein
MGPTFHNFHKFFEDFAKKKTFMERPSIWSCKTVALQL